MGTLVQALRADRGRLPGERFADHRATCAATPTCSALTRPDIVAGDPRRVPGRRRRHHRDQHVHGHPHRPGRLRAARSSRRDQPRGRSAGPRGGRRGRGAEPGRPRYVLGALGPTNRTASISPDVADPGARNVTFDELADAYPESAEGLIEGGADLLVIETIFDTLNAKAAIFGVEAAFDALGERVPLVISGTITDASRPDALGPDGGGVLDIGRARPAARRRAQLRARRHASCAATSPTSRGSRSCRSSPTRTPGCPTSSAATTRRPRRWPSCSAQLAARRARSTSRAAAAGRRRPTSGRSPRPSPASRRGSPRSSSARPGCPGCRPLAIPQPGGVFVNVGERTNVTGSRKFARLILEDRYDEAVEVARQQVEAGAQLSTSTWTRRCSTRRGDDPLPRPDRRRARHQRRAGDGRLVEAGRSSRPGSSASRASGVVNSISLKEGEGPFLEHARLCRRYGAAVVVMAFDEQGQADTAERKVAIASAPTAC